MGFHFFQDAQNLMLIEKKNKQQGKNSCGWHKSRTEAWFNVEGEGVEGGADAANYFLADAASWLFQPSQFFWDSPGFSNIALMSQIDKFCFSSNIFQYLSNSWKWKSK